MGSPLVPLSKKIQADRLRTEVPEIHEGWNFYKAGPSPTVPAWFGANLAAAALGLARVRRGTKGNTAPLTLLRCRGRSKSHAVASAFCEICEYFRQFFS